MMASYMLVTDACCLVRDGPYLAGASMVIRLEKW